MAFKRGLLLASAVSLSALASVSRANLLTNGSFEDQTYSESYAGTTNAITGWDTAVGGGPYDGVYVSNGAVTGKDGNNYLGLSYEIGTTDPSYRPAVTPGEGLTLSLLYTTAGDNGGSYDNTPVYLDYFTASGAADGSDRVITLPAVTSNGLTAKDFLPYTGTDTVPANAASVGVRIVAPTAEYDSTDLIDNVQLNPVPEPASLALVGLSGLAFVRRRRANG